MTLAIGGLINGSPLVFFSKMPFSFRRCLGNHTGRWIGCPRSPTPSPRLSLWPSIADAGYLAEGHVECKLVPTSGMFKKRPWMVRYCVLRREELCLYKNEAREEKSILIKFTYSLVQEFSTFYRLRRLNCSTPGVRPESECVFTLAMGAGDKIKLRVRGEEDANYWMTKLRKVFKISPRAAGSGGTFEMNQRGTSSMLSRWRSPPRRSRLRNAQSSLRGTWSGAKAVRAPLIGAYSPPSERKYSRDRLATEFVDALRRTDSMLEGRQTALRSRLEARRVAEAATIASTKAGAISDHEEEISRLSSISPPSAWSDRWVHSPRSTSRPSSTKVEKWRRPSAGPSTTASLMRNIDDRYRRSREESSFRGEVRYVYTSSAFIRLTDCRPPTKLAKIDYGGEGLSNTPAPSSTARIVANSATTAPKNTISYSVSPSKTAAAATTTTTSAGLPPFASESTASYRDRLKNATTPAPPPPPPLPPMSESWSVGAIDRSKASESIKLPPGFKSMTPPLLPSSFLTELREAALKRQMSMQCEMSSFRSPTNQ